MNKKQASVTKWIAVTALLTALVAVTGYLPKIPMGVIGNLYWCDGMILIAAFLMDPLSAFIAGGLGTVLLDLLQGNAIMCLASFLTHGLQAVVVSALFHYVIKTKSNVANAILSFLPGLVIVVLGYFTYRCVMYSFSAAIAWKMIGNVVQEILGIAIAVVICFALRLQVILQKNNLLPCLTRKNAEN